MSTAAPVVKKRGRPPKIQEEKYEKSEKGFSGSKPAAPTASTASSASGASKSNAHQPPSAAEPSVDKQRKAVKKKQATAAADASSKAPAVLSGKSAAISSADKQAEQEASALERSTEAVQEDEPLAHAKKKTAATTVRSKLNTKDNEQARADLLQMALDLKELIEISKGIQQTVAELAAQITNLQHKVDKKSSESVGNTEAIMVSVNEILTADFKNNAAQTAEEDLKKLVSEQLAEKHSEALKEAHTTADMFVATHWSQINTQARSIRNSCTKSIRRYLVQDLNCKIGGLSAEERKKLYDEHDIKSKIPTLARKAFKIKPGPLDFTRLIISSNVLVGSQL